MFNPPLQATPPAGSSLTDYDRQHIKTYLRLLDAAADGADWREAAAIVLGLDVAHAPRQARRVHESHLARARWMSTHGYLDLLRGAPGGTGGDAP
ncbi:DNA -binding domain-containing protein [Phenylobacterium sp.]|uniref:DNA -binding domain-containing protein n=1 Tax=Phenylobacterium sp. TaxID=1871053 RepID=UPI00390C59DF